METSAIVQRAQEREFNVHAKILLHIEIFLSPFIIKYGHLIPSGLLFSSTHSVRGSATTLAYWSEVWRFVHFPQEHLQFHARVSDLPS